MLTSFLEQVLRCMFQNGKGHRLYHVFARVPTSVKSFASKALSMCLFGHLEGRTRTAPCPPPSETSMPIPMPSVPCQRVLIEYSERSMRETAGGGGAEGLRGSIFGELSRVMGQSAHRGEGGGRRTTVRRFLSLADDAIRG